MTLSHVLLCQIINGTLWVDHLPWHNYERGVPWHALSPDSYNSCAPRLGVAADHLCVSRIHFGGGSNGHELTEQRRRCRIVTAHHLARHNARLMRRNKGWTASGKARVPLMLVGLMDVLHAFPGQIPDLDAVLSVADFPCVPMCVLPRMRALCRWRL